MKNFRINICTENGGRIEFQKHISNELPKIEGDWFAVMDCGDVTVPPQRYVYLFSCVVAYSVWIRPKNEASFR